MSERPVDQVGEHGLDDRVATVGDIGVGDRFGGVGEERVIAPHWKQRVGLIGVFDARTISRAVTASVVEAKAV